MSWIWIARKHMSEHYSIVLQNEVDNHFEAALAQDILIFPMNTTGPRDVDKGTLDHFTLLIFEIKSMIWRHYNSIIREDREEDMHYERSKILIHHVELKMREVLKKKQLNTMSPNFESEFFSSPSPKQMAGTLDCGLVVCGLIYFLVMRKTIPENVIWTTEHVTRHRAKLLRAFITDARRKQ